LHSNYLNKIFRSAFLLYLFFSLFKFQLFAQSNEWFVYNSKNSGIKDNFALSLTFDKKGNTWIGTKYSGLVKFDGIKWEIFMPDSSIQPHSNYNSNRLFSGPQYNAFYAITIDENDIKWIGTKIGGLVKFDGVEWTVFNTKNSPLPNDYVWSVVLDKNADKWMGTIGGGVAKFDGINWTIYNTENSELPHNDVYTIIIDNKNNKWIGTAGGLAKFDGSSWEIYNSSNSELPVNTIWAIAIDSENNKWIGTNGGGLIKFDGSNWYSYSIINSGIPDNNIISISIDSNNNKWIGTLHEGLIKFDDFSWQLYNSDNSELPDNTIWDIKIDKKENIWIGTNLGLALIRTNITGFDGTNFQNFEKPLQFILDQNYPNPFKLDTTIRFKIFQKSQAAISIYNIQGKFIKKLIKDEYFPGSYSVFWNGKDENGIKMPCGTYFCLMKSKANTITRKIVLLR